VNWKDRNRADAMVWPPVRNEGKVPCDSPSQEDDFLERINWVSTSCILVGL
jgi:hypothetical protein